MSIQRHDFHSAATDTGNGKEYTINESGSLMTIDISGTATVVTAVFQGCINENGNFKDILCYNRTTGEIATNAGSMVGIWECPLAGYIKIRVRLTAVSGGYVNIDGTVD